MARIRTIKPDYWSSPKTARLTLPARLLFLGLLNESDDEGRQIASPRRIAGALFPHDDLIDTTDVAAWLAELEHARMICRYEVDGVTYLAIPGFLEHQRVSHPTASKLPPPPSAQVTGPNSPPEPLRNDSRETPEPLQNSSGGAPEVLCPEVEREREGEVGGEGPPAPTDAMLAAAAARGITGAQAEREHRRMHDWYQIRGAAVADWPAAWRRWLDRVEPEPARHHPPPALAVVTASCDRPGCDAGWLFDLEGNARRCDCTTGAATA